MSCGEPLGLEFEPLSPLIFQNYNPKLADFGLAKYGPTGEHTHISTRVIGTYGYAAPEYIATGTRASRFLFFL